MATKKKSKNFMTADRAESWMNSRRPKSDRGRGYQYGNDPGYPATSPAKKSAAKKAAPKKKGK
jgi:hypothetical protein